MWETWVRSLHWEDPLEKGKASHSSILAWRFPWTVQSMGSQKSQISLNNFHFQTHSQVAPRARALTQVVEIFCSTYFCLPAALTRLAQMMCFLFRLEDDRSHESLFHEVGYFFEHLFVGLWLAMWNSGWDYIVIASWNSPDSGCGLEMLGIFYAQAFRLS